MDNKIYPVSGIKLGTTNAGIKQTEHDDLCLIEVQSEAVISGVFTRNAFCAAPVQICRQHLQHYSSDENIYLLINTGNANAGTGQSGYEHAIQSCQRLAQLLNISENQVFPFSTGVIGESLPIDKIVAQLETLSQQLNADNWDKAAAAILTTDLVAKKSSRQIKLAETLVHISGISKGSGMIKPDMATMLAFIATDLSINQKDLDNLLQKMNKVSFNRISVDGDTSTNDSCMLMASGKSQLSYDQLNEKDRKLFESALQAVFIDLARAIVLDGEGATKLITIEINQGKSSEECLAIAYTIAHSPLIKTAFFASDPNWGRILAAVGRSGIEDLDINTLTIYLEDLCIVENGGKSISYTEEQGQQVMNQKEITIRVNLNRGMATETVWSCDFSYDYVKINAEYRT